MAFFQSPTHLLTWFVNNWNSLKDKCQLVNHIFVDRKLSDDIHFSQPDWLLCCVHKSLSLKEDERKQLLQALLAAVKNQDQPAVKQQAIKREYVSDKSPPTSKQPRIEVDDLGSEQTQQESKSGEVDNETTEAKRNSMQELHTEKDDLEIDSKNHTTYAAVAKGKLPPAQMPKQLETRKVSKVHHESSLLEPDAYEKLTSKGKYMLEFHAMLADGKYLSKDDVLCVWCQSTNTFFELYYNERFNIFQISVEMSFASRLEQYKYVTKNGDEKLWEQFPFPGKYNRQLEMEYEQRKSGLVICFDVVTMESCSTERYAQLYHSHICQLLPSYSSIITTESDSLQTDLTNLAMLYNNFLIAVARGLEIVNDKYYREKLIAGDEKNTIVHQYIDQNVQIASSTKEDPETHTKLILTLFTVALVMEEKNISIDNSLKISLCYGLSLHDLQAEDGQKLLFYLDYVIKIWNSRKRFTGAVSFRNVITNMLKELTSVPHFLLLLPLYKLIQTVTENASNFTSLKPTLPHMIRWSELKIDLRKSHAVNGLKEIAGKISLLSKRFPWIIDMYAEVINLDTMVDLMENNSGFETDFSPETIFNKIIFLWRSANKIHTTENISETATVILCSYLIDQMQKAGIDGNDQERNLKSFHEKRALEWIKYAKELFNLMKKNSENDTSQSIGCFSSTFNLITAISKAVLQISQNTNEKNVVAEITAFHEHALACVKSLFHAHVYNEFTKREIQFWNILGDVDWSNENFSLKWQAQCREAVAKVVPIKYKNENLLEFYANEFESMEPSEHIKDWCSDVLMKYINENLKFGTISNFMSRIGKFFQPQVFKLCRKIFTNQWNKHLLAQPAASSDEDKFLSFLQTWSPLSNFLQILCHKDRKSFLETKQKDIIDDMHACTFILLDNLRSGEITVSTLNKLSENTINKRFWECYNAMVLSNDSSSVDHLSDQDLNHLMETRRQELSRFLDRKNFLESFVHFAFSLQSDEIIVDMSSLTRKLDQNISSLPLKHLVTCQPYQPNLFERNIGFVVYFDLDDQDKALLSEIQDIKAMQSRLIVEKMRKTVTVAAQGRNRLTLSDILQLVWLSVKQDILEIVQPIEKGIIQLHKIKVIFQQFAKDSTVTAKEIHAELTILYDLQRKQLDKPNDLGMDHLETRTEQIVNYFKIRKNYEVAATLRFIQKLLKLEGDFKVLKMPLEVVTKSDMNCLFTITSDIIEKTKVMENIASSDQHILLEFAKCGGLIKWLKENMKNIGEVQVLSDLAMISAGETPIEVDRVSCFLSAVMGFAPLIFDLSPKSDLNNLLNACEKVWENVKRDERILQNWVETNKHLEWLKGVKDFHGSVEKSSLIRAQEINSHGIYRVGGETEETTSLKNCIRLFLHGKDKEMTLNELHDLQSRLMLIAGEAEKGKNDVTKFTELLSNVESLAKAYILLKESGCLLFNNWKAFIRSKNSEAGGVTVEVYFDDKSPVISSGEDLTREVKNLTTILLEAHAQWMSYLTAKRGEHYHLNHFNIHQLTYLCKQLAGSDGNDFTDQTYMLLRSVSDNVNDDTLLECLEEVTRIDQTKDDDYDDEDGDYVMQVNENLTLIQKKTKVVRKLVASDLPENVAKAAVQAVSSLDVDECYLWGLEHGYLEDDVDRLKDAFDEEMAFEAQGANVNVLQNVINERSNLTLEEVIERIQSDLEENVNETVGTTVKTVCERYFQGTAVTSLDDCISLEHLGQFLSMLARLSHNAAELPVRNLPEQFIPGRPHMIICPQVDVWRNLLNIYMCSPDQPMPSSAEVLICCEKTSLEDVELLLRRAIQMPVDNGNRIYCLACADELSFDVAKATEAVFQRLTQMETKNIDYLLVILTTSSHHYITSCFDEYKIDGSFPTCNIQMEDYLKQHLRIRPGKFEAAAQIDHEQSLVRVVLSESAGMGKSLFINRRQEQLSALFEDTVYWNSTIIRFLEKRVDVDDVVATLTRSHDREVCNADPHFIHIDITPSVQHGVHKFLFELIILGMVKNSQGVVWRRRQEHFYGIEYTTMNAKAVPEFFNLLHLLPSVTCLCPLKVRERLSSADASDVKEHILMDTVLLNSDMYQRPYQYLERYTNRLSLDDFIYNRSKDKALECLNTLLRYCSIRNPSWLELSHFAKFLNIQLLDCERSVFCDLNLVGADSGLVGFKEFVVRFMIRMSQDFATPSLNVDEDDDIANGDENDIFELHQLRRRWESGFHPYLFFNDDRVSMSFVHFNISREGHLCHPAGNQVLEENVMSANLFRGLQLNKVNMQQNFDQLNRHEKLGILCQVFGIKEVIDPDPTYELTTDNCLKMLAIHMRFRCGIPVIVMGETGCGKTRMVEFMSLLKSGGTRNIQNMVVVKVHGGITVSFIQNKVKEAITLAEQNKKSGSNETVLFLDEANTTEAIYAIKEVVCDGTVHGECFKDAGLKIVAACNPYKRHTDEAIKAMERSGLGFNVKTEDTVDNFAGIPMRHLVYRVISLPPSMQPLVWDFGQLNDVTEAIYIRQMVFKMQRDIDTNDECPNLPEGIIELITEALSFSQKYMRQREDICSFVSLRDVERTIQSFKWFHHQLKHLNPRIQFERNESGVNNCDISYSLRSLIQALGMCYHATLSERNEYREQLAEVIATSQRLQITGNDILNDIIACQKVFINAVELEKDIAKNEALRENVFMIVVCAEMRIPLFLVGKPGSSKSLAKTVVTDAMQGRNSRNELFQNLKQIQVLSFQCSAVSDAVGIEAVFGQCAQLQKKQDRTKFVAVVVLDEIGLAEDSPKMPLKVLHPLLETASLRDSSFNVEPHSKVGFVGISNWALDPAKMNRGIFVTRGEPSKSDLHKTAEAIFKSNENIIHQVSGVIKAATDAYLEIYQNQENEFFGLRDYYGLLKMIHAVASEKQDLEFSDVATAIVRNFSGSTEQVFKVFEAHFMNVFSNVGRIYISVTKLIHSNLCLELESRFMLLLTKQYSAVSLLPTVMKGADYQVIFGSSFPHDNDYTQMCKNINRVKVCMESGRTVVLLNLRDLYESLYDALNQHYVTFAGQRYVDLGLGGHRVKCRIAQKFRLIVIEEKETVYNEFPIPLINRLEKYVFDVGSVLPPNQVSAANHLKKWLKQFSKIKIPKYPNKYFRENDAFAGYTDETAASTLLSLHKSVLNDMEPAKRLLIQTASLDAVCRLPNSDLLDEAEMLKQVYMEEQEHDTLWRMLRQQLEQIEQLSVLEVVTYSQILNERDRQQLEKLLGLNKNRIMLVTLQQFKTEQEYSQRLDDFFQHANTITKETENFSSNDSLILLLQCPQAHLNGHLIACAKYSAMNKVKEFRRENPGMSCKMIVAFLLTVERHAMTKTSSTSFTSFHSQHCQSLYVDEVKPGKQCIAPVTKLWNITVAELVKSSIRFRNANEDANLDVIKLLSESIPDAMAKLRDQNNMHGRNRVRILNNLLFPKKENDLSHIFCDVTLRLIHQLLQDRERKLTEHSNWILEEACSIQSLQEGGSFRNILWLRLRKLCALALAKVVCTADVDDNLDIISNIEKDNHNFIDLWFKLLMSQDVCDHQWLDSAHGSDLIVQRQKGFSCRFPFVRALYKIFCQQWSFVVERNLENKKLAFIQKIKKLPVNGLLEDACEQNGMFAINAFATDLAYLTYKSQTSEVESGAECEVIKDAVIGIFKERKRTAHLECNALIQLFLTFMEIKPFIGQFAQIIAACPPILTDRQNWNKLQEKSTEFIVHQLAFTAVVKKLHNEAAKNIGSVESCMVWELLVAKTKPVAEKLINTCNNELQQMWERILFVEIFLDQLIPATADAKKIQHYLTVLAPLARRLWSGASRLKDLSNLQFLNIVTNVLQGCTGDIRLAILCQWGDVRCRSCKANKLSQPVKLPCGHYLCLKCIPVEQSERSCPTCREKIENPQALKPAEPTKLQEEELERFKAACTSFFLEYLSTLCFPEVQGNDKKQPPNQKITVALERLVICENNTRMMSPLLSNFDTNPTARSYILQLLLRCDKELVRNHLDHHFRAMESVVQKKDILMGIYIQCLQDVMQNFAISHDEDELINVEHAAALLHECTMESEMEEKFTQIDHLDFCAKLVHISKVFVTCIVALDNTQQQLHANSNQMLAYTKSVCNLCKDSRYLIVKQYIIKNLCRRYGMDAFKIMLNTPTYRSLIPENLLPNPNATERNYYLESDLLVLSGESYVKAKAYLLDVMQKDDLPQLFGRLTHEMQKSPNSNFQVLLALSVWAAHAGPGKNLQQEVFCQMTGPYQETPTFFRNIAQRAVNAFELAGVSANLNYKLNEFVLLVGATLLCKDQGLLNDLASLVKEPDECRRLFLPTMPASDYFAIRHVIVGTGNPRLHFCPNGHPYFIGECTRPVEASRCSECGAQIGGEQHRLFQGNNPGNITEESQAGYRLIPAEQQKPVVPERKLTKLSVCALRACLHSAMLLGTRKGDAIGRLVNVQGSQQDVNTFLLRQIHKDFKDLSTCLGRSVDDTFIIMHQILHRMRLTNVANYNQNCNFQTMAGRNTWEEEFQRQYLSLIFRDTDTVLNEAQGFLVRAGKLVEKPLQRLVYELKRADDIPDGLVKWDTSCLWKYRINVDMQHLRQRLEAVDAAVGGKGAMLKKILGVQNLELLRSLHTILSLQSTMIARYRQRIDMADADETTIQDYLEEQNYVSENEFKTYIKVWNKVRQVLQQIDRYRTLQHFFDEAMNLESPISMCLPSKRGRGRCAMIMVEFLANKQNDLLQECRDIMIPHPTFPTVDVAQLTINDFICISEDCDLMPLVLANSQYETITSESGSKHTISYNLGLLEKKVMEKFILRKAIIKTETIPLMLYPQDMGLKQDFQIVQTTVEQIALPVRMCQDIDAKAESSMTANVCEVVRTVTLIIQFLAKLGGEPDKTICDYAENDLLLPADETEMIPRSAQIRHCLALYERLSWHRARKLALNGQNSFENVVDFVEDISEESSVEMLRRELSQMNVSRLQLELNSLLMVGPEMNAEWGLSMVLQNYLDGKHDGDNSWCDKIPDDILFKHSVHVFNVSMEFGLSG
ncbi:E3 ubiquitin-protein ligase rnf213-alpha-like [Clavelina lepadiformis]|uniref:E3 ubiquitin-protein ligase rnf213-alpha-like n=1 Tax=Clavelina lepadiformis TaxID=159417 RepID=UPI00404376B5